MVTFQAIAESLEDTERLGDADVRSVDEAGEGSSDVAELWFDGPVETTNPVIADEQLTVDESCPCLLVESLDEQLGDLLSLFVEDDEDWGIDDRTELSDDLTYDDPVKIGPFTQIGSDVSLGRNVRIGSDVHIRGPASIGDEVTIRSGVKIESPVSVGKESIIHSNTVIGSDGYGYDQVGEEHFKIPQIGRVEIGSHVEIGAGVAIDRATFGATVIGDGSKLDNHVHVAHNCKIGKNCLMVAKSGLAGSVTLGDNVILAGMAAVEDHHTLADNVIVAAKSGVTRDIEEEGKVVSGFPARDHGDQLKIQAILRKLPKLRRDIKELKAKISNEGAE